MTKIAVVFIFLSIFFISSCLKPEKYPDEPVIEFESFVAIGDIGEMTISFTDGDGDIGLEIQDTLAPYDDNSYYYYNLYLDYYEIMDGDTVRGTDAPGGMNFQTGNPISWPLRIENITPVGQNKALKGKIKVTIEPHYFIPGSLSNDSLLYKIVLIDRALNISNEVMTPIITR